MTAERPDFQSDSVIRHAVKLNTAFQEIMRDDAQDTLPGDTLGSLPTLAQEFETKLTASSDGTIVNNPTIGGKTPAEIEEPVLSQELRDRLAKTSPRNMLPPEERKALDDLLTESARVRIQALDDLGNMPLGSSE